MGCLLISGHTGLFQLYISDCGSKVLVLVGLRQVFLWETQENNVAGDAGMTNIVLVSTNFIFQYSLNSLIPFTLTWKMKFFRLILIFPSYIFFLFFFVFQLLPFYTQSQLYRVHGMSVKHTVQRLECVLKPSHLYRREGVSFWLSCSNEPYESSLSMIEGHCSVLF